VLDASVPALVHPGWRDRFPWLVQGTTTRGSSVTPFDLGLFSGASAGHHVREHWSRLLAAAGMPAAVHAPQVHAADVLVHRATEPGLTLTEACDGHLTVEPGALLAVTVADCVPVFAVSPAHGAVAVLHAGWRGAAAGVLERGVATFEEELGAEPADVWLHLGPSICGDCYEVGPEVFEALGQAVPDRPTPIDLRRVLAERAVAAGVRSEHVTVSTHCTRCTGSDLFSHRGGDGERQVAYVGIRE
jgi:hypothetical protein